MPVFGGGVSLALKVLAQIESMRERRATQRQRVFKVGSIEFDGACIDCTIRNLSTNGAAFDVVSPLGIPHEVTLNIVTRRLRQRGYVVWRREQRVGMVFAG
jgi:hypothetical protein